MTPPVPATLVLVEGGSDAAALRVLARSWGTELDLVELGGVTNASRHADRLRATHGDDVVLLGVCDAREQRFLARVDPPLTDVFVCDRDLEDELIRASGAECALDVLAELDELGRFRTFCNQPEWRGRPQREQLRRFAGTRSGRKTVFAEALAGRLVPATTPAVLARLLRRVAAVGPR